MDKYIAAGVGTIQLLDGSKNVILTSKTLIDEGFSTSVTGEEIRGGLGNTLLGKYFHDSLMNFTITDALFNLQYLAINLGGTVTQNGSFMTTETVTVGTGGTMTVQGTPVAWNGTIYGWWTPAGTDNWTVGTFTNKTLTDATATQGATVCVQYFYTDAALQQFVIPASIIPQECYMIMTYPLFKAGTTTTVSSTSSQVGTLMIEVPRFLPDGAVNMAMSSSGAAQTSLAGSALAYTSSTSCASLADYAIVSMHINDADALEGLQMIAIDGGDSTISVATSGTYTIETIGVFNGGRTGIIEPTDLTYVTTGGGSVASSTGVFTAPTSAGTSYVTISVTTKPAISAVLQITVA